MMRCWLVAGAVWILACDAGSEAPPAAEPEPALAPPEPALAPPEPPALDALEAPGEGRATAAVPRWNAERRRLEHETVEPPAKLGTSDTVVQILLGDEPGEGVMLTFYGRDLAPGTYPILPATDETRSEHAGRDSKVAILTVGGEGDLRSESGTLTIGARSGDRVSGTVDAVVRSRSLMTSGPLRGRFEAKQDAYMDALLEHEAAIREQLRRR